MKMTVMAKELKFTSIAKCKKTKHKGPRDKQNMKIYSEYKLAFNNVSIKKYSWT